MLIFINSPHFITPFWLGHNQDYLCSVLFFFPLFSQLFKKTLTLHTMESERKGSNKALVKRFLYFLFYQHYLVILPLFTHSKKKTQFIQLISSINTNEINVNPSFLQRTKQKDNRIYQKTQKLFCFSFQCIFLSFRSPSMSSVHKTCQIVIES